MQPQLSIARRQIYIPRCTVRAALLHLPSETVCLLNSQEDVFSLSKSKYRSSSRNKTPVEESELHFLNQIVNSAFKCAKTHPTCSIWIDTTNMRKVSKPKHEDKMLSLYNVLLAQVTVSRSTILYLCTQSSDMLSHKSILSQRVSTTILAFLEEQN